MLVCGMKYVKKSSFLLCWFWWPFFRIVYVFVRIKIISWGFPSHLSLKAILGDHRNPLQPLEVCGVGFGKGQS